MPKIFITREIPENGINLLKEKGWEVGVGPEEIISQEELLEGVKGADAILSVLTEKIDREVMEAAGPQLKIIANYAVGYDNIDIAEAKKRGISATNTPGVLTEAVAEHTIALLLAAACRIAEGDRYTRAKKFKGWGPKLFLGADIHGKTLAIIGLGRIGSEVARRMRDGFDLKIIYYDIRRNEELEKKYNIEYREIDALLKEADFISLHTALTPETRHLISAERLKMMKPTSYLINTSRGPIIDEKALVEALKNKTIAGAALDVFENEPELTPGLTELENVVLTPHIASATKETRDKMSEMAAQNIIAALEGRTPPNLVK
ncbi:MAG: D-glycerate dehydrogenase [Candidatus Portnoybacteria bacterium RIFCSPLOWO2_12_FULL_39_9]|uniref:D-glycerate dehydrogenase n=1 Tax=Candidatus Portnoybacteria bacterium RIFCSPHIGHO2_12_FULL_38_9 TaxID=1801997 RepID=A0A1G2FFW4_9BACT|nr:MAG: D-glycerate dehydrogenase [Candidatus Portnoybacteria bacterium RBG_13_40_8]OGZ36113.1 MAG: D-glycerate dehydrogenase [Candidatus Portnoybacteria bacterium RIFCSPHIGHO2_02_FULL_39_12]OGZ36707.1 MAG: D-glycerate dehydrogenase [Candidatus Portnoybacteria bacterium RIFCSPHIGHO2_12_FULL_38_9]OGZ38466.1 MAG: D-glycerate dehydrogenase [Candidatus Portnoybacteria bacterium RIFCSPLOWO2_01_FULL_38_39]OGZ40365.1 MAG: D-glycerate dehydrogenase [Candidatus Portnoybacteria bacterium RIFCSPLOWO2_12_F